LAKLVLLKMPEWIAHVDGLRTGVAEGSVKNNNKETAYASDPVKRVQYALHLVYLQKRLN
jgi:hypothetical protein